MFESRLHMRSVVGNEDPVGQQHHGAPVLMDRYRNAGLLSWISGVPAKLVEAP